MIKSESKRKQIKTILQMIRAAGGTYITIDFDGSGDSGSIHHIDMAPHNMDFAVIYDEESATYSNGEWIKKIEPKTQPVMQALEQICYDMLEVTGIDWYNNDGGFGQLEIDLTKGSVKLEVNQRYTEYNTDTFDLNEDLEFTD